VGPQLSISCPFGAVDLVPGTNIPAVVQQYPGGTTFCVKAGIHRITSAITPKTGDTFVGEYGAILDGTGWTTADLTQAAFRSHNQDIDDVIIRNLVIQHMPQRGVHAFPWMSDRWIVEYTEIWGGQVGIQVGNQSVVRHNWIHHNIGNPFSPIPSERGGGYSAYQSTNVLFEQNEISYNGAEQKVSLSNNVTFRDNFVHHNRFDGIWYDGDNLGSLIERNVVEDNPGSGIFYEISGTGVIRNNIVRRGEHGVFISTSRDVEIYNNMLEDNLRGIEYFISCSLVGGGAIGWDLLNDIAHDNIVRVGAAVGSYASALSYTSDCVPTQQLTAYVNGSKQLQFVNNRYAVPSIAGNYWLWGTGSLTTFSDWQGLGLDRQGSVSQDMLIRERPLR